MHAVDTQPIIRELQTYLNEHIPITREMRLHLEHVADGELVMAAPLTPNHNDKGTGFAGSLYSAMVLTGWSFVTAGLKREGLDAQVAVTQADIRYIHPVTTDFRALCKLDDPELWRRFVTKLNKRRNYTIELPITITHDGDLEVAMTASYIAWFPPRWED